MCTRLPKAGSGPEEKNFSGPSARVKSLYTKLERQNLNCRATWVWSARVNLYNRHTYAAYSDPGPLSGQPSPSKFYRLPAPGWHCVCVIFTTTPRHGLHICKENRQNVREMRRSALSLKVRNDAKLVTDAHHSVLLIRRVAILPACMKQPQLSRGSNIPHNQSSVNSIFLPTSKTKKIKVSWL